MKHLKDVIIGKLGTLLLLWDSLTVIQAVEGDAQFSLSERGIVNLTEHCATVFTPSPTGNCRYQKPVTKAWFTTMLDKMRVIGKP